MSSTRKPHVTIGIRHGTYRALVKIANDNGLNLCDAVGAAAIAFAGSGPSVQSEAIKQQSKTRPRRVRRLASA